MNDQFQEDLDRLLTEIQVAEILNLSVRTLQMWRFRRTGLKYVQAGRTVRYRRSDLIAWIDANTIGSLRRTQS